jgi:hypothetical protein
MNDIRNTDISIQKIKGTINDLVKVNLKNDSKYFQMTPMPIIVKTPVLSHFFFLSYLVVLFFIYYGDVLNWCVVYKSNKTEKGLILRKVNVLFLLAFIDRVFIFTFCIWLVIIPSFSPVCSHFSVLS